MYEVPSRKDVARVVITRDVVLENVNPTLVPREKEAKRERRDKSASVQPLTPCSVSRSCHRRRRGSGASPSCSER